MCSHCDDESKLSDLRPLLIPDLPDLEQDRNPTKALPYLENQLELIKLDARFELIDFSPSPYCLYRKPNLDISSSMSYRRQEDYHKKEGPWQASFYVQDPLKLETKVVQDLPATVSHHDCNVKKEHFWNDGETHVVDLKFNSSYPDFPPMVSFRSTIRHPLIQTEGQVMPILYYQKLFEKSNDWPHNDNNSNHVKHRETIMQYAKHVKEAKFFSIRHADPLPQEWLHPSFLAFRDSGYTDMSDFLTNHEQDIYSFPLFNELFCNKLVEEIRSIYDSGVEIQRPNSMNRYGVILNLIGMEGFMTAIQYTIKNTNIAQSKFGFAGSSWTGHHSFVVQYSPGHDLGLDMHTDDSDVTCNICLGVDGFEGSQVAFCGKLGADNHRKEVYMYQQKIGHCLIHLGRQRHGAVDIQKGERMNLIIWSRSWMYRQTEEYRDIQYEQEKESPDEVCLSYTHDKDYGIFKSYRKGLEGFRGMGWCPPEGAEYDGFKPENRA